MIKERKFNASLSCDSVSTELCKSATNNCPESLRSTSVLSGSSCIDRRKQQDHSNKKLEVVLVVLRVLCWAHKLSRNGQTSFENTRLFPFWSCGVRQRGPHWPQWKHWLKKAPLPSILQNTCKIFSRSVAQMTKYQDINR